MKRITLLALCMLLFSGMAWAQVGEATGTADTGNATEESLMGGELNATDDNATGEQPMGGYGDNATMGEQPMAFEDLDQDADQEVSWQEFQQAYPEADRELFDTYDMSNTGSLNQDEWQEAQSDLELRGYESEGNATGQ
jgi:hypothetical protein